MIIEIRMAGFVNKGAELMLRAVLAQLRERYPDAVLTMVPTGPQGEQPYDQLARAGLRPKFSLRYGGQEWGDLLHGVPARLRRRYGLVLDREVDVVIDAAGFAYSDQWGVVHARALAEAVSRWRRRGTGLILLPQAFGPFADTALSRAMSRIHAGADLVIARDAESYSHLLATVGTEDKLRIYPDFTNLLDGVVPESFDPAVHGVCLVPNARMLDMTDAMQSSAYLPFMIRCAEHLRRRGARPFVLVHETRSDGQLAAEIANAVGGIPVLAEADPLCIKGILGASQATLGSRYHGLVSALSQGVPSLALGWSHKYAQLLADYGRPGDMVSMHAATGVIEDRIDALLDPVRHAQVAATLRVAAARLRQRTLAMWTEVFELLDRRYTG